MRNMVRSVCAIDHSVSCGWRVRCVANVFEQHDHDHDHDHNSCCDDNCDNGHIGHDQHDHDGVRNLDYNNEDHDNFLRNLDLNQGHDIFDLDQGHDNFDLNSDHDSHDNLFKNDAYEHKNDDYHNSSQEVPPGRCGL